MKKWIAIILVVVMTLSLCACSKDNTKAPTEAPTEAPTTVGGETNNNGGEDDNKKDEQDQGEKVNVSVFTEILMSEKNIDGGTDTTKNTFEYDDDYNLIGSKTYINGILYYEATYDKDVEKPLLTLSYDEDGNCADKNEYTYDADGNCVVCINTSEYGGKTFVGKYSYTYDADGNLLSEIHEEYGHCFEWRFTYNAEGLMLAEEYYYDGELQSQDLYTYTDFGEYETIVFIQQGVEVSRCERTYDEYGNILTNTETIKVEGHGESCDFTYENTYDNGKLVEVKLYNYGLLIYDIKYDSQGNEISTSGYDQDSGEEWALESTYENGKLVKEVRYCDGVEDCVTLYSYNADGKLTERSGTYTDSDTQGDVYTYNETGDLVGMKSYMGDEITYEYTTTYETVTVSEEAARKIKENNDLLAAF